MCMITPIFQYLAYRAVEKLNKIAHNISKAVAKNILYSIQSRLMNGSCISQFNQWSGGKRASRELYLILATGNIWILMVYSVPGIKGQYFMSQS